ncbi:MAG: TolC family protein [Candidatus Latescibacteria bacterium]|nr:TolC family protein [Candidatus Latescibacterota bacterium]
MIQYKKIFNSITVLILIFYIHGSVESHARELINLSLESAVDIAMKNSYRIKQLELGIKETRYWLKSERAALKSKVYMNLISPEFDSVSDSKWNSTLGINEIVRQNTRRWQMDLSVKQPVIVLGHPTNGYLSLNNKVYRYLQKENGMEDVDYYNRFFIEYEQPFFRPNELKNDIENAELNVKREELGYIRDRVNFANNISYEFYTLYELVDRSMIYSRYIEELEEIYDIAHSSALQDTTQKIDEIRARVELTNARELLMKNLSALRLQKLNMKQRLRLNVQDSLMVEHTVSLKPINVDFEQALQYGYTLRPHIRLLNIEKRRREIVLDNAHGWDSFHMELEITLGFEKNDDMYSALWDKYSNSYSVSLNAYIPIWDWGQQKSRLEAQRMFVKQADLNIEENLDSIKSSLSTTLTNLEDYQQRALNLQKSVTLAQEISDLSIQQYRNNKISLHGVLQIVDKQRETELNFLDAYLGYRRTLESLKSLTYYDYEENVSLLEKFRPVSSGNS